MNCKTILVVACLLLLSACHTGQAQDTWIGRTVMPRNGAKFLRDSVEIPENTILLPLTVSKVQANWLWIGRAWVKSDDVVPLADATSYYTEYLRNNPKSSWAYSNRGCVWSARGEPDNAIQDFSEAIRLDPKYAKAYNNRGAMWSAKGELDNAIKDYNEAIRLDSTQAKAYNNRGVLSSAKGELDSAIKDYSEAIRLDPKYANAYNNLSWLYATCPNPSYRDGGKAVDFGKKACELSEWKSDLKLVTLAAAYAELGNFDKAIRWLEKAIEMKPESNTETRQKMMKLFKDGNPYRDQ